MDLFDAYMNKRFGNISQPYDNPDEYMKNRITNRLGLGENGQQPQQQDPNQQYVNLANSQGPRVAYQDPNQQPQQGPVAPQQVQQQQVPQAPQAPQAAPAPQMNNPQQYNNYVAQNESGANPNIGYHDQSKSSAYGKYGITKGAYQDIQKANPKFAGRDITSLTPQEQDEANQTYAGVLSNQLQKYGIEPHEGHLGAAHFLGANGLARYLKDGYISKAAAAANGGYDNVKRIVDGRLAQQPSPASGAAPQQQMGPGNQQNIAPQGAGTQNMMPGAPGSPAVASAEPTPANVVQPQPFTGQGLSYNGYNENNLKVLTSGDPKALSQLAYDPATPKHIQQDAYQALYKQMNVAMKTEAATKLVDEKLQQGDINGIEKAARREQKSEDGGSYIKAILFARLGLGELAKQEMNKISPQLTASTAMVDGKPYTVWRNQNNEVVKARDADGNQITSNKELSNISAKAMAPSSVGHSGTTMFRDSKGQQWAQIPTAQGPQFQNVNTGEYGRPTGQLTPIGIGSDLGLYGAKKDIDLNAEREKLKLRIASAGPEAANKAIGEHNAMYGDNITYQQLVAPQQQSVVPPQQGAVAPQQVAPAPQAAPAPQGGAVSPQQVQAQPKPVAQPAPAPQQAAPGTTSSVTLPPQPVREKGESPKAFEARMKMWQEQAGKIQGKEAGAVAGAQEFFDNLPQIKDALEKATSSGLGHKVDETAAFFGYGTEGAGATAQLRILSNKLKMNVPRFEGPQSDRDVKEYSEAAGNLADDTLPLSTRKAALATMERLAKKYYPQGAKQQQQPAQSSKPTVSNW